MSSIHVPEVPPTGLKHLRAGRNGAIAHGPQMASVVGLLNTIALRRGKVLLSKYTALGNFMNPSGQTFYGRFYCSPYVTKVLCTVLFGDSGTPTRSAFIWKVDGVVQAGRSAGNSNTVAVGPSDFFTQTFEFVDGSGDPLAAGVHTVECNVASSSGINGFCIYEATSTFGETVVNALAPDQFAVGAPVTGANLAGMHNFAWLMHRQQGTHHIHWTHGGIGASQTGATYKNILDGTTTGFAAAAAGFWTIPYRQATLAGATVPVTMWVYAGSSGVTGRVRFVNSAGVIATITGIGANGYYTATGTLDPTLTSDLVIVEHSEATGGQVITTQGAGLYSFDT